MFDSDQMQNEWKLAETLSKLRLEENRYLNIYW